MTRILTIFWNTTRGRCRETSHGDIGSITELRNRRNNGSEQSGPFPRAVEKRHDFDFVAPGAVDKQKWQRGKHQLTRSGNPPWTAHCRMVLEQLNYCEDAFQHQIGSVG